MSRVDACFAVARVAPVFSLRFGTRAIDRSASRVTRRSVLSVLDGASRGRVCAIRFFLVGAFFSLVRGASTGSRSTTGKSERARRHVCMRQRNARVSSFQPNRRMPGSMRTRAPRGARVCSSLGYLVDPASSHMLVSKIKPCMSKYKRLYCETANGSLNQLWFI